MNGFSGVRVGVSFFREMKMEYSEVNSEREYVLLSRFGDNFEGLREAERSRQKNPIVLSRTAAQVLGKAGADRIEEKIDGPFWYRLIGKIEGALENLAHLRRSYPELFKEANRFRPDRGYSLSTVVLPAETEDLSLANEAELVKRFGELFDQLNPLMSMTDTATTADSKLIPTLYVTRDVMRRILESDPPKDTQYAFVPIGPWQIPRPARSRRPNDAPWYEFFRLATSWEELVVSAPSACIRQSNIHILHSKISALLRRLGIEHRITGDDSNAVVPTRYVLEYLLTKKHR